MSSEFDSHDELKIDVREDRHNMPWDGHTGMGGVVSQQDVHVDIAESGAGNSVQVTVQTDDTHVRPDGDHDARPRGGDGGGRGDHGWGGDRDGGGLRGGDGRGPEGHGGPRGGNSHEQAQRPITSGPQHGTDFRPGGSAPFGIGGPHGLSGLGEHQLTGAAHGLGIGAGLGAVQGIGRGLAGIGQHAAGATTPVGEPFNGIRAGLPSGGQAPVPNFSVSGFAPAPSLPAPAFAPVPSFSAPAFSAAAPAFATPTPMVPSQPLAVAAGAVAAQPLTATPFNPKAPAYAITSQPLTTSVHDAATANTATATAPQADLGRSPVANQGTTLNSFGHPTSGAGAASVPTSVAANPAAQGDAHTGMPGRTVNAGGSAPALEPNAAGASAGGMSGVSGHPVNNAGVAPVASLPVQSNVPASAAQPNPAQAAHTPSPGVAPVASLPVQSNVPAPAAQPNPVHAAPPAMTSTNVSAPTNAAPTAASVLPTAHTAVPATAAAVPTGISHVTAPAPAPTIPAAPAVQSASATGLDTSHPGLASAPTGLSSGLTTAAPATSTATAHLTTAHATTLTPHH